MGPADGKKKSPVEGEKAPIRRSKRLQNETDEQTPDEQTSGEYEEASDEDDEHDGDDEHDEDDELDEDDKLDEDEETSDEDDELDEGEDKQAPAKKTKSAAAAKSSGGFPHAPRKKGQGRSYENQAACAKHMRHLLRALPAYGNPYDAKSPGVLAAGKACKTTYQNSPNDSFYIDAMLAGLNEARRFAGLPTVSILPDRPGTSKEARAICLKVINENLQARGLPLLNKLPAEVQPLVGGAAAKRNKATKSATSTAKSKRKGKSKVPDEEDGDEIAAEEAGGKGAVTRSARSKAKAKGNAEDRDAEKVEEEAATKSVATKAKGKGKAKPRAVEEEDEKMEDTAVEDETVEGNAVENDVAMENHEDEADSSDKPGGPKIKYLFAPLFKDPKPKA